MLDENSFSHLFHFPFNGISYLPVTQGKLKRACVQDGGTGGRGLGILISHSQRNDRIISSVKSTSGRKIIEVSPSRLYYLMLPALIAYCIRV
jgi:hypothetical protein